MGELVGELVGKLVGEFVFGLFWAIAPEAMTEAHVARATTSAESRISISTILLLAAALRRPVL